MKTSFFSDKGKRILFVVFAFVLSYVISFLIDPYSSYWNHYFDRGMWSMVGEWVVTLIFCLLISESSIFIHTWLNKRLPWTENPGKRLALEVGMNLTCVLILIFMNVLWFYLVNNEPLPFYNEISIEHKRGMIQWVIVSAFTAFFIITINTGYYLVTSWKNTAIEAAEHKFRAAESKQLATEAELQALKLQIDPHFVFNNLSVLSELILSNQQLGYEYAESFSKVYRYLLVNSKKDVIILEDELKFLNAYIFLIQHRSGDGVRFNIEVDKASRGLYIPPLTLQLLVENALKHNKMIKTNPLEINIYNNDNRELVVENKLILIEKQVNSSGIGIQNIIRRYSLLSERIPEIVRDEKLFKVIIPLIKYDK